MLTLSTLFSTGLWLGSILLRGSKNPVHSVFYLVLVFLCAAAQLILLSMDFFGRVLRLVYVGALAIMFLFVVMLLDINVTEIVAHQRGHFPLASLYGLIFIGLVSLSLNIPRDSHWSFKMYTSNIHLNTNYWNHLVDWSNLMQTQNVLTSIATSIYTVYADLLIMISLILRIAMVGAVVLTLQKRINVPFNDVLLQHTRRFERTAIIN